MSIKLAAADPLAYYNILESVCRTVMRATAISNSSSKQSNKSKASSSSSSNGLDSSNSSSKHPEACSSSSSKGQRKSRHSKRSSDKAQDHTAGKDGQEKKSIKGDITGSSSSSNRVEGSGIEIGVSHTILDQVGDHRHLRGYIYAKSRSSGRFVVRTWQHYKAYLSAHGSYSKALMKLLLVVVERGLEDGLDEEGEGVLSALMTWLMKSTWDAGLGQYAAAGGDGAGEPAAAAEGVVGVGEEQQQQQQRQEEQAGLGCQAGGGCGGATTAAAAVVKVSHEEQQQQQEQRGEHQVGALRGSLSATSSTVHMLLLLGAARAIVSAGGGGLSWAGWRIVRVVPEPPPPAAALRPAETAIAVGTGVARRA